MEFGDLVAGLPVRRNKSCRTQTERRQPARVATVQMEGRSPDGLLIAQNIFEELAFERRAR